MENINSASTDAIDAAAALWLSRRDRGLSAAEQDEYMHWLAADVRHAEAVARHVATLERMMQLYEWQPAHDTEPNPDLFAPPAARPVGLRARFATRVWLGGLAAAAALTILVWWMQPWSRPATEVAAVPPSYLRVNERLALPDGSRVELRDGSKVVVQYSDNERRVKLTGGEAHFTVWKDKARPFIVEVAGIEVKAVGTAFNVRLDEHTVEVLVTEGKVGVSDTEGRPLKPDEPVLAVSIGERVVVPLVAREVTVPEVTSVTNEEISRELAWQAPRLQFQETRLADAVAEFNRSNRHQLELGDATVGELRIGGTFRPDNVEGFIRALEEALQVKAVTIDEHRTVLRTGGSGR